MKIFSTALRRLNRKLNLLDAKYCLGQTKLGVERGPQVLRDHGLLSALEKNGYKINDMGNLSYANQRDIQKAGDSTRKNEAAGDYSRQLAGKISAVYSDDSLSVVVGGDHSISVGSIAGALRKEPKLGVVWVDAHADINTPETSPSGNIHGMPLSFLTKLAEPMPSMAWLENVPPLLKEHLVYIGLRDVDEGEKLIIEENNILAFYRRIGEDVNEAIDAALEQLQNCSRIHLSYDIDSLDPKHSPSTGTAVPGGLSLDEGRLICSRLMASGKVKSFDLVEVNPEIGSYDDVKNTCESAVSILDAVTQKL